MSLLALPPIDLPLTTETAATQWYNYFYNLDAEVRDIDVLSGRTVTTSKTIYVRTDGSDSNNGSANTTAGAFKTIQAAVNYASLHFDTQSLTVQVAAGTYAEWVDLPNITGAASGTSILLLGDATTPSNVIIDASAIAQNTIRKVGAGPEWSVQGFRLKSGVGLACLNGHANGWIRASNIDFNSCGYCVIADHKGTVELQSNYSITASPSSGVGFVSLYMGYILALTGITGTLTGTPNFATAFAYASDLAFQSWLGTSFSGGATGPRYSVTLNSVIDTGGGGANFLPGNSAGASGTGGQYG